MGILRSDNTKKGFAEHLANAFTFLAEDSVEWGLNGRSVYKNKTMDERIVSDIVDEFGPVKELLENRT